MMCSSSVPAAPQYYPPPEEIHDEGGERVGEAIITGAVSPLPTTLTQHQSPNVVFVERTGQKLQLVSIYTTLVDDKHGGQ